MIKQYEHDFNERLRWISEKDDGLYDAMNKGFSMATGDVIGIINSDDVLADPAAIEKVVKCFERDETIDAVYADLYYVAQNDISKIVQMCIRDRSITDPCLGWEKTETLVLELFNELKQFTK